MQKKVAKRHELFAREYLLDHNGTRAAIAAGYSPRSAAAQASALLNRPKVIATLAKLEARRNSRLDIKADDILAEIARVAYANMADYIKTNEDGYSDIALGETTRDQSAAIQEIRVDTTGGTGDGERRQVLRTTFKLGDKLRGLEMLGRHLKMFTDKVEVSGLESLAELIAARRKAAE